MKKLSFIMILLIFTSCSQKPYYIKDFVAEALHQAIGLEKIIKIRDLLNKDTIYVYPHKISVLPGTVFDSSEVPSHIDMWRIKVINKNDLNGFIKTNQLYYLKMDLTEENDNVIISLEKAFEPLDEKKHILSETEGIKVVFKKINVPQITEISEYRIM